MLFIEYPKCSTCQKARHWLEQNNIVFEDRNIVVHNPKKEELEEWIKKSQYPIKKFYNTSGLKYKELDLKNKLAMMSDDEQIALLATDGMLVKRPLLICDNEILIGFNAEKWQKSLNI